MLYAVVPVVAVGFLGVVGLGWQSSGRAVHPGKPTYTWSLADYPELAADEVTVHSRTGAELAGRFFAGRERATVVLSHGYGGTQDEMLPVADALHRAGLGVFTYDLRGCGRSTGEVTFGAREQDDLISVVDYVASRGDVDPARIGALGFSMGGATTLMAAAREPRIRAIVADSAWSDVNHWLRPSWGDTFLHPRDTFTALSLKLAELRTGIDLDSLRPAKSIARIGPRPVLLVHGSSDEVVPPTDAEENLAAAGDNAELWRVGGVRHTGTVAPGGAASSDRVVQFFRRSLSANGELS